MAKFGSVQYRQEQTTTAPQQGLPEGLFNPGAFIPGDNLVADEKDIIRRYYPQWRDGDPIPAHLPQLIAEAQRHAALAKAEAEAPMTPVPLDTPPVQMPQEVTLDPARMSARDRELLAGAFAQAKKTKEAMERAKTSAVVGAAPGVNEAIQAGLDAAHKITNERREAQRPAPARPQAAPSPPPATETPHTTSATPARHCPYCGWDQTRNDTLDISDEDKRMYVAAQSKGGRFQKEFKLLNDTLRVTFRSMTVRERGLIKRQLTIEAQSDTRAGVERASTDLEQEFVLCTLCVSLQRMWTPDMGVIDLEELEKYQPPKNSLHLSEKDTIVRAYTNDVADHVIVTEDRRRILTAAFMEFSAIMAKIEANAGNDDFFRKTGSRS